MFPRTSNILHTPHLYPSLFPRGYSAIQLALAPNFSVNQLAGKADMGSLVHSGECGKATGVSEVSFHLDLVADNCICGSRRLMLCFLVRRTTVYCCSQVYFVTAAEGAQAGTYLYDYQFFSRLSGSSYAARQQQRRLCSVALPLFCPRRQLLLQ